MASDSPSALVSVLSSPPSISHLKLGESEYDPSRFANIKDTWITQQLKAREQEFTTKTQINVFCGTWNVNGKRPMESLAKWLLPQQYWVAEDHWSGEVTVEAAPPIPSRSLASPPSPIKEEMPPLPDIYAIGFQELDLRAEALLLGDTTWGAPWEMHILQTLERGDRFSLLMSKQLVGMFLLIFAKEKITPLISDIQVSQATTGIMGVMGNKGGVAIHMMVRDSTFCFVNCHLNAHLDNVLRRNQDYQDICRRIFFKDNYSEESMGVVPITSHEHLFWFGDLNYRIDGLDNLKVRELIGEAAFDKLLQYDQLVQQMDLGACFSGFSEGPLSFAPTYKYDNESVHYDTGEKKRIPAWCDRVLYRSNSAKLLNYRRHELLTSDHRPISASFSVDIKHIESEAHSRVYNDVCKQLDKLENELMPDVTLSIPNEQNMVNFEGVYFLVSTTVSFSIKNTGPVVARFRFVPKLNQRAFCKAWLSITPSVGMMIPGEVVDIKLTILVDKETGPKLNMGLDTLEDIVILHLENGKDYFINVTGKYYRSFLGCSLDYLIRFPAPIRCSEKVEEGEKLLSIPKELWRIVDYLFHHGINEEDLFLLSGVQAEMEKIRECLDTGASLEIHASPHSMAEVLIRCFEYLPEPVIPPNIVLSMIEAGGQHKVCKQILGRALSEVNYNVFYYVISFLREILKNSQRNRLTPEKLGNVFARVLLGDAPSLSLKRKIDCMVTLLS